MDTEPGTQLTLVGSQTGTIPEFPVTRSVIYDEEGPYVFKVEDRLFRFPTLWNLVKLSEVFSGMIQTGGAFTSSIDGRDDDHPIEFSGDRAEDFEAFAAWLFQMSPKIFTTEQWLGVLTISTKYLIVSGVDQAIHHIEHGRKLADCYKLRIAWQFGIEKWYDGCLNNVLNLPHYSPLSAQDISDLEPTLAAKILRTRELTMQHRLEMIPYMPEVSHHSFCRDNAACARNWKVAYSACVAQFAYAVPNFLYGDEILDKLKALRIDGMQEECLGETVRVIDSGFAGEQIIIQEAKNRIKDFLRGSLPTCLRPACRYLC